MPYRALVFDFFGVICSEIAPFWLTKYFSEDEATAIKGTIVDEADRGIISQGRLFSLLGEKVGIPSQMVEREWNAYVKIDAELVKIIARARKSAKVGLLTNSPAPFVRRILDANELTDLFDSIVVSSEEGCAKPDKAIYAKILAALSIGASDALMIDDNPANIEGALSIGMGAVLFRSPRQLESVLRG